MNKMININLNNSSSSDQIPSQQQFNQWCQLALHDKNINGDINIQLMDATEIQQLNKKFRQKDKPTNVLSFPHEPFQGIETEINIIGDIAICPSIIQQEAKIQQKSIDAHWAHMCIHAVLHLLGYDHQTDDQADTMETIEINLLQQLGYNNPYE